MSEELTISVGERRCRKSAGHNNIIEWYHCFLALSTEGDDPHVSNRVVSQIHFVPNNVGYLTPKFYKEIPVEHRGSSTFFPVLKGCYDSVAARWNHMGKFADSLSNAAILFGTNSRFEPTSTNCRTGVRETMKAGDLELRPEFTKCVAGMEAPSFFLGQRYIDLKLNRAIK
jgi:hypothetical protein